MTKILIGVALVVLGLVVGFIISWIAWSLGLEADTTRNLFVGVLLVVAFSSKFDNPTDGVVYGTAAGLGFAVTENVIYGIAGGIHT